MDGIEMGCLCASGDGWGKHGLGQRERQNGGEDAGGEEEFMLSLWVCIAIHTVEKRGKGRWGRI